MLPGAGISGMVIDTGVNLQRVVRPACNIGRRNGHRPGTVRVQRGAVLLAIHGDQNVRPGIRTAYRTADHYRRALFNQVNHVVTCHGVDADPRKSGVNFGLIFACATVAVDVGDFRRKVQFTIAQRGEFIFG